MGKIKKLLRMLIKYPLRFFNGISLRATVIDSKIHKKAVIEHHANVRYSEIDRYTYVSARSSVIHTKVGSFCSIAAGVAIGGGAHDIYAVSTSPIFNKGRNIFGKNLGNVEFSPYKKTTIGNDVWIGNRVLVLQGVTIGDGAVVGAGSVVTKDIPPYEIWAGNPAKKIKDRFDDETKEKLLKLKWWEMSDSELKKYGQYFGAPQEFIKETEVG